MNMSGVVTTINPPNSAMLKLVDHSVESASPLFIVGDVKTSNKWEEIDCQFLSIEKQKMLNFETVSTSPLNHYARKNIGYLCSMEQEVEWIYETDDDNSPIQNPFLQRSREFTATPFHASGPWLNTYEIFLAGQELQFNCWPRGFDLESVLSSYPEPLKDTLINSPIQQGLANGDPDVDAIFRLTVNQPIKFNHRNPVVLTNQQWSPINSQTTWWARDFFRLMYLPATCTFRLTDILRGFVAVRILREYGQNVSFFSPVVYQDRNEHNLLSDFSQEVQLYRGAGEITEKLDKIQLSNHHSMADQMTACYESLLSSAVISKDELISLANWMKDCDKLGLR